MRRLVPFANLWRRHSARVEVDADQQAPQKEAEPVMARISLLTLLAVRLHGGRCLARKPDY